MTARRVVPGRQRAPAISIIVEEPGWRDDQEVIPAIRKAARTALKTAAGLPINPAVSVLLAGDRRLQELNETFRKRAKVTNVLSFPAPPELAPYLGDIALAYQIVGREAVEQRKTLSNHAAHLTVHAILHLLGYDHERPGEAAVMEQLEISHLAGMGIGNPYLPVPVRNRAKRNRFKSCRIIRAR